VTSAPAANVPIPERSTRSDEAAGELLSGRQAPGAAVPAPLGALGSAAVSPARTREGLSRRAWRALLRIKLRLVDRRKYQRTVLEDVDGLSILVLPEVFNPKLLRTGEFLVQQLRRRELLPAGSRVLDMGSGSGAGAVAAARAGCSVVAVDINPSAVRCTRINALLNNVAVDTREGDLFAPVEGERFDVVLFNPPYYRGVPRDALDHAWRSPDLIERFSCDLSNHLTEGGRALLVLSSDGEQRSFLAALHGAGFRSTTIATRDLINETLCVYSITAC